MKTMLTPSLSQSDTYVEDVQLNGIQRDSEVSWPASKCEQGGFQMCMPLRWTSLTLMSGSRLQLKIKQHSAII